jgi:hypothetical protein
VAEAIKEGYELDAAFCTSEDNIDSAPDRAQICPLSALFPIPVTDLHSMDDIS